jgi:hypothetical protein
MTAGKNGPPVGVLKKINNIRLSDEKEQAVETGGEGILGTQRTLHSAEGSKYLMQTESAGKRRKRRGA